MQNSDDIVKMEDTTEQDEITEGDEDLLEEENIEEEFNPNNRYSSLELTEFADKILREDSNRELCRKCKEKNNDKDFLPYGIETGQIESVPQFDENYAPLLDEEGNQLYIDYPELQCERGHRWFKGEGQRRDIRGPNPILFESHLYNRKRREIYVECVDELTECLTLEKGWTSIHDLSLTDTILSFSKDSESLVWTSIEKINQKYVTSHSMIRHFGNRMDALTTLNHKWPIRWVDKRTRKFREIRVYTSNELNNRSDQTIILGAPYYESPENSFYEDSFIRLLAWNLTEGHVWGRISSPRIAISQSKDIHLNNCQMIYDDITALGGNWEAFAPGSNISSQGFQRREGLYARENNLKNGRIQYILSGTEVDKFIDASNWNRAIPTNILTKFTQKQIKEFVKILLYGDGNQEIGQDIVSSQQLFFQHNKERSDSAMVAAILAGFNCSLNPSGGYTFSLSTKYKWLSHLHNEKVIYDGLIWCPTTPTGFWLARRKGKTFITGNSGQPDPAFTLDRFGRPTQGMYYRTHPQGRRVNTDEQRKRNGSSYYR